jgi:hypothetical protein
MATLIEPGIFGSEAGISDHVFVQRLRQLLRDNPISANEQANGNGTSTYFQMQKVPVYDDKYLVVAVDGIQIPLVASRIQVAPGNCWMDTDTGQLVFGTAPDVGAGNIIIQKQRVRWSNSVLLQSLNGGLRQLFPTLFKWAVDTSVTLQVNQWDYTLPNAFWDPRVRILSVSIQEVPSSVNRPVPISGFTQRGLTTIDIPTSQRYTPGATVWIEYTAPYRSLTELEPQAYDLPLWYAAAQLLGFDEARRTRMDTITPTVESSASPPMYQQNAGSWFLTQFKVLLTQLAQRPMRMPRAISSYER